MKTALLLLLCSVTAIAQQTTVAISKEAPNQGVTTFTYKNAGGNPQYACKAKGVQLVYVWAVTPSSSQGTLTNIVVSSNVGTVTMSANHGLNVNNIVTVFGSTTAALNGTYIIQTGGAVSGGSATAFTITTVGVSNGTYATTNLAVSTLAPRTTAGIWSIEQFTYDSTGFAIADQYANGNTAQTNICDNRAVIGFN